MSDLSRLLDDVYNSSSAAPPTEAPAWSSDEALEELFAGWVPGPPDEAPAQERAMFAAKDNAVDDEDRVDDWAAIMPPAPEPESPADQVEAALAALAAAEELDDDLEADATTVPLGEMDSEMDDESSAAKPLGAFALFESVIGEMTPTTAPEADPEQALLAALESVTPETIDQGDEIDPPRELVAVGHGWSRQDDDILPAHSARRFRLTLRR